MSDEPDSIGIKLELQLGTAKESAEIRFLRHGIEVARGPAIESMERRHVPGIDLKNHRERLYDLHAEAAARRHAQYPSMHHSGRRHRR